MFYTLVFSPRVRAGFSWQKMMWFNSSSHLTVLLSDTKIDFLHVWPINGLNIDHYFGILLSAMTSIFMKCNELKLTWFESTLFWICLVRMVFSLAWPFHTCLQLIELALCPPPPSQKKTAYGSTVGLDARKKLKTSMVLVLFLEKDHATIVICWCTKTAKE